MAAGHVNEAYLPGMALHAALRFEANLQAALDHAAGDDAMAIIASPVAGLAEMTRPAAPPGGVRNVIWSCKALDPPTGAVPHAIVAGPPPPPGPRAPATGALAVPRPAAAGARGSPCAVRPAPPRARAATRPP